MTALANKLATFGKTGETKADKKYPELNEPKLTEVATNLLLDMTKAKALDNVIKTAKKLLSDNAKDEWFKINQGQTDYQGSVVIPTDREKVANNVIVNFTEGYQVKDLSEQMKETIGPVAFSDTFEETFVLSIDGSQIDKKAQDPFLDDLIKVLTKHGIDPGTAIKAKSGIKPKENFNSVRMREFDAKTNAAIEAIYPVPCSVSEHKKSKGDETKVRKPKAKAKTAAKK